MVDFSIIKPTSLVDFGIKTIAAGGGHGNSEKFYRLSSGLLVQKSLFDWAKIEGMVGYFSQTLSSPIIGEIRSTGLQMAIGWLQTIRITPAAEVGWGAFHSLQQGQGSSSIGPNSIKQASQSHALKINLNIKI